MRCFKGMVFLYHVTREENVPLLRREGLRTGMPPAEAKLAGVPEEGFDDGEMSDEERAREMFNGYLREACPPGMPAHDDAVFFWSDRGRAASMAQKMERQTPFGYAVVVVDSDGIPCTCYEAVFEKAEDLFTHIEYHIREYENIDSMGPETDEDEVLLREAQGMARDYYASMRPFTGTPNSDMEVVCGCDVPPEAVVDDDRCPDCQGGFEDHNAVNRVTRRGEEGLVAHSRGGGTCWKSFNHPFTYRLLDYMEAHPERYALAPPPYEDREECDLGVNPLLIEYGGIPPGGGYDAYTEYEVGAQRIAEEAHCILGSLYKIERWGGAWETEVEHIFEEMGLIERDVRDYGRDDYIGQWWRGYPQESLESMREVSPVVKDRAVYRLRQLEAHREEIDPYNYDVAVECYRLLEELAEQVYLSVVEAEDRPTFNAMGTWAVRERVDRLREAVDRWKDRGKPGEEKGEDGDPLKLSRQADITGGMKPQAMFPGTRPLEKPGNKKVRGPKVKESVQRGLERYGMRDEGQRGLDEYGYASVAAGLALLVAAVGLMYALRRS